MWLMNVVMKLWCFYCKSSNANAVLGMFYVVYVPLILSKNTIITTLEAVHYYFEMFFNVCPLVYT